MVTLESLLQHAKENDDEATLELIDRFWPKMQFSLKQVPYQEREDLKQELCLKMIEVIRNFT